MTSEAQRIAIAEACGYKWMTKVGSCTSQHFAKYKPEDTATLLSHGFVEGKIEHANDCDIYGLDQIPDYLNDLNAMHEAEKTLITDRQQRLYVDHLFYINNGGNGAIRYHGRWAMATASAAQKAEAFLKSLDLWTE